MIVSGKSFLAGFFFKREIIKCDIDLEYKAFQNHLDYIRFFFTPVYTTVFIFRSGHYILLVRSSFASRLLIYLSVSFFISSIHSLFFLPLFYFQFFCYIQSSIHYFLQFNQTFLNIYHFVPFCFLIHFFHDFISFFFLRSLVHSFKIY